MTSRCHTRRRAGVAIMWALVVMSLVTVLVMGLAAQLLQARRITDNHRNQLQSHWLARSGAELATAKLLSDPEKYTGETVKLVPNSEVKIVVKKDASLEGTYHIESQSRYPVNMPGLSVMTVTRTVKRVDNATGTRMEQVASSTIPDVHSP